MRNIRNNHDDECQYLGCYSMGVENVPMKVDEDTYITFWACQKHAKLLGDNYEFAYSITGRL